MRISRHAIRRIRQRLGVKSKNRAMKLAKIAFNEGVLAENLSKEIRDFANENCHNAKAIVYKNFLYIFKENTLITLFGLPNNIILELKHKREAELKQRKIKIEEELSYIKHEKEKILCAINDLTCPNCWVILDEINIEDKFQLKCTKCRFTSKKKSSIPKCKKSLKTVFTKKQNKKIHKLEKRLLNTIGFLK